MKAMSESHRKGDTVVLPGPFFGGAEAKVVAVSRSTGGLTLEFLVDCGKVYKKGDRIHLMPYEVRPKEPR